jgi:thymidylate synthase
MNDFVCTNAVSYTLRDDKLHVVVQMRSNDAVYGYKNDRAWQLEVQSRMCEDLKCDTGRVVWQVQNLHVYERHFDLV